MGFITARIYPQIPLWNSLFFTRLPASADRLSVEAAGGGDRWEKEGRSCSSHAEGVLTHEEGCHSIVIGLLLIFEPSPFGTANA